MKNLGKKLTQLTAAGFLATVSLNAFSSYISTSNYVENKPTNTLFGGGGSHGFWYIFEKQQPWDSYFVKSGTKSVYVKAASNNWNHAGAYLQRPSGGFDCDGSAYVRGDSGTFDLIDAATWTYAAPSKNHNSSWSTSFRYVGTYFSNYYNIPATTAIRYVVRNGGAALIDNFRITCDVLH